MNQKNIEHKGFLKGFAYKTKNLLQYKKYDNVKSFMK